jgi:hypothetical protein
MSTTEGRKRLQPRMSRGSWKIATWSAGGQAVCSALLSLNKLRQDDRWDVLFFWVYAVWFASSTIYFLYLLRIRRNDAPYWEEEEAHRADWDRRGRQL